MDGFTKVSNEVVFDEGLSFGARVAYSAFLHLAWRAGRRRDDHGVELPPLDATAKQVGCSRTALRGYLDELRKVGLVVTVRVRNQGMSYFIFDTEAGSDSALAERRARAESALELGQNPPSTRARSSSRGKDTPKKTPSVANPEVLPDVWLDPSGEGRPQNLPLNALCDVCDIGKGSPRIAEAVVALNGRGSKPGIRALYWQECSDFALPDQVDALLALQQDPERFARLLEQRVRDKARRIREHQPWRTDLNPSDVLKLWVDIDLKAAKQAEGGALTPEQIASGAWR